jgi:hypothetical protein
MDSLSRFILSFGTPSAIKSVGNDLVIAGLIGEALIIIILKSGKIEKALLVAAALIIAVGVWFERIADNQSEAPRLLTTSQQQDISSKMSAFPKTPVVFGVFQDPEAIALLNQMSRILISANWVEQEWKGGGDIVLNRGPGHPSAGYTYVGGLYVQADNSHAADFGPIARELAKLLSDDGISANAEVGRMTPNDNKNAIRILIGQKPR